MSMTFYAATQVNGKINIHSEILSVSTHNSFDICDALSVVIDGGITDTFEIKAFVRLCQNALRKLVGAKDPALDAEVDPLRPNWTRCARRAGYIQENLIILAIDLQRAQEEGATHCYGC